LAITKVASPLENGRTLSVAFSSAESLSLSSLPARVVIEDIVPNREVVHD
jgi:hypothetical protein